MAFLTGLVRSPLKEKHLMRKQDSWELGEITGGRQEQCIEKKQSCHLFQAIHVCALLPYYEVLAEYARRPLLERWKKELLFYFILNYS